MHLKFMPTIKYPLASCPRPPRASRELPLAVQYAVHQGLGCGDALAGLTRMPAKFLKLDSIGTLAPGKDADLVVLSGPPFDLASQVLAVMIDGQWVYEREAQE